MKTYFYCRPKGGHVVHIVDPRTREAVCGQRVQKTTRMGASRAGWQRVKPTEDSRMCERCVKRYEKYLFEKEIV